MFVKEKGRAIVCKVIIDDNCNVIMGKEYDKNHFWPIEEEIKKIDKETSLKFPIDPIPRPTDPIKGPKTAKIIAQLQDKTAIAKITVTSQEPIKLGLLELPRQPETFEMEDEEIGIERATMDEEEYKEMNQEINTDQEVEEVEEDIFELEEQQEHEIEVEYEGTYKESYSEVQSMENTNYYFGKLSIITYYDYDNQGNLIQKETIERNNQLAPQVVTYKYNINNQLIETINNKSQRTIYTYSPTGLRNTKITEGKTIGYYYDRENVIIETENGKLKARNLRGNQLISREENSTIAYYLFNGHGDEIF